MSENQSENWNLLHLKLKSNMQQELSITRDLLGNMHQEELSLIIQDQPSWNRVMIHRSQMLERLKTLRLQRLETTQEIVKTLGLKDANCDLEKLLPLNEEISYEIFNIRDQLIALTERMNHQQNLNHHLIENNHSMMSQAQRQPLTQKNSKAGVTTCTIKRGGYN